jgi:putative hydrolase of the HAD superfamily
VRAEKPVIRRPVWLFDLDDTLHHASHAIYAAIDRGMTDYVMRQLALDEAAADALRRDYWRRYGATLLGLVRHHGIDPRHFLHTTHDFDVAALLRAERGLLAFFARLPGRKLLLTNAPDAYAKQVVRELRLHRHLGRRYAIESMRIHGQWRPKPSRLMLRALLARERVAASAAILVEDSPKNLKAARAVGLRTVLVRGHARQRFVVPVGRASYVGLRLHSVRELPRRLSFLRR